MTSIVTRTGKGAPLSISELDANFTNLNTDKVEKTRVVGAASGELTVTNGGALNQDIQLGLPNTGVSAGTLNNSATQTTPFTVDAKGRITGTSAPVTIAPAFASLTSTPTTLAGYGITDAQPTITGAATTIDTEDLTASRALVSDANGKVAAASVTATELGYLANVTQNLQTQLDGKQGTAAKDQANGYAGLNSSGKLSDAVLPDLAISEYLGEVANEAAMLALTGQKGDWCTRTDVGTIYIITGNPASAGGWMQLSYPGTPVKSVAGKTGVVTLTNTDVGLSAVTNDAQLKIASNLSDLNNAATARTNLGLGNVDNTSDATKNSATVTLTNKTLTLPKINDTSSDHTYNVAVSELTANRTVTLPLLTTNDTFVFQDHAQTLQNKTISGGNNTLSNIGNSSLTNSSITFGSTAVSLGGTVSALNGVSLGQSTAAAGSFTTLSASSTVTLSGGTANGVVYLNASKQVTTGTGLVFDGTNLNTNAGTAATAIGGPGAITSGLFAAKAPLSAHQTAAGVLQYSNSETSIRCYGATGVMGQLAFQLGVGGSADAEYMRLTNAGLGLGVTPSGWSSTSKAIDVGAAAALVGGTSGVGAAIYDNVYINSASQFIYKNDGSAGFYQQSSGAHYWYAIPPGTNNTAAETVNQLMTLNASGFLLLGKTTADPINVGLIAGKLGEFYLTKSTSTNADATYYLYSYGAAAYRFYVGMGGTIYATSTTISAISDQRFKENIQDLDVGLSSILALKPRKFDWKEGKGKNIKGDRGFIAQEFEQVFPDLIDTWKDEPPAGEEPYKAVRADLIPVLVKAIQELTARLESLEQRI